MSKHDDDEGGRQSGELPVVPALLTEGSAVLEHDETDLEAPKGGAPEQLGFSLRFEGGRALLALDRAVFAPGLEVKRALFEVPDVEFPLDVTGGATRFQDRRLTLRGVELALAHDTLFVPDRLRAAGLTLLRERTRPGGLELLVSVAGAGGDVPVRARGLFVAAGDAGVAVVLHEVIPFGAAPRPRLELSELLLDALAIPGGQPARAMVRRAHPFRALFSRLLPAYGWKVPAMGEVRVHEVVLAKGQIVLRAWAGEIPDGWKPPRRQRQGPLEEAVALALFADDLAEAKDDKARLAVVDRLLDDGGVPPAVVPFAAELLRREQRRRAEGDDLVTHALERDYEHLGLLSAHVDEAGIDAPERARRLLALGRAADVADEPWVSARAFLVAAELAEGHGDKEAAKSAAEAAWSADPTHGPTGALFVRLAVEAGEHEAALKTGRAALERLERPEEAESLAVTLAPLAHDLEGADAARALLRRALRREDRLDALMALVRLEIADENLERAAETLTRLLAFEHTEPSLRADVHLLAAELAEARGDLENARLHLGRARDARPGDAGLAVRQAALHRRVGDLDRAIDALQPVVDDEPAPVEALLALAELRVARAAAGDAEKALAILGRAEEEERTKAMVRVEAEARALLGDVASLAQLLEEDAGGDGASEAHARAAELYASAGHVDDAARVILSALSEGQGALSALAAVLVGQPDDALAHAVADALSADADEAVTAGVRALSAQLKRAGRPRGGHAVLRSLDDVEAVRERADLAAAAGDPGLERKERARLCELLEPLAEGPEREELHATWRRLAVLEGGPGGGGPEAEAAAWAHAASLGDVDVSAWLESALASDSLERLSEVLRRKDADLARVPADALREAATGPWLEDAADVRVRLLEAVAERDGRESDAGAYLEEARLHLPAKVAAAAFARLANRHSRAAWLLAASDLEEDAGDAHAALHRLLGAVDSPLVEHLPLLEALLERALEQRHVDGITRAATGLYAHTGASPAHKAQALSRASAALVEVDREAWRAVTGAWLDVQPAADEPLVPFVEDALRHGQRAKALARLRARLDDDTPAPAAVLALLEAVADDARDRGEPDDEVDGRELLARAFGAREDGGGEAAVSELLRLADLYAERGDLREAVSALSRRVSLGGDREAVASCLLRIADLEEQRERPEAAADALTAALQRSPDDAATSQRLVALLEQMQAWERLAGERARRAQLLPRGPDRTAALVKLGDLLALKLERPADAEVAWLNAIRSTWSEVPLARLLNRAQETNSHRLFVRAHLAAARAQRGEPASALHAMEAGAALAALLDRPTLAIPAYRFAADHGKDPLPSLRALLELCRAVGDIDGGLVVVDRMRELSTGPARALTSEMRADLLEVLAGDREGAEAARREALAEDPTLRVSALALVRMLRQDERVRDAISVRRQLADAAEGPAHRAQTYAALAESARDELADLELAAELAREALSEQPLLLGVRLLRAECLEGAGRAREAAEELGWLLEHADLPAQDRVSLCRRKAALEREQLGDLQAARRTLRTELARAPTLDVIADEVAEVEDELGEPGAAAQALAHCLSEHPDGTDVLGNRREVLERIARLLEDAKDPEAALEQLLEAAELGRLTRGAELRRARLAEALDRPDVAVTALSQLLGNEHGDAEETVALLGRLAVAAEKAGDPAAAMTAWRERAERVPADTESLFAVERLARVLQTPEIARAATEHLVRLEVGDAEEARERYLWLAADSRRRLDDAASAYLWLERAVCVRSDAHLLGEMLGCAEEAGDPEAALDVLARLEAEGARLPSNALLRRAELSIDVSNDMEAALGLVREALAAGEADEERATRVLSRISEERPHSVLAALLDSDEGSVEGVVLRRCLGALARFTAAELARLADRFEGDEELVTAAAEAEVLEGDGVRATDRLLALAAHIEETHGDAASAHRERAAEVLLAADIDSGALLGRFAPLKDALARDRERRLEALHLLRDAEAYDLVAELLERALDFAEEESRRALRMELVAMLRDGLDDPARAAVWLEEQVVDDPDDREAWGELLECLDELGEDARLAVALGRRIERTNGIERRELIRRRTELLLKLDRGDEALGDLTAARAEAPRDATLKDLERRLRSAGGTDVLAAFLSSELRRDDAEPQVDDAATLLALQPSDVAGDDRVVALAVLSRGGPDRAHEAAQRALTAPLPVARRVAEAMGTAVRLEREALAAFLGGLAATAPLLGVAGALELTDALYGADVEGVGRAFGLSSVARRARAAGPAAALEELRRLGDDDVPATDRARASLSLALRLGQADVARSHVAAAALDSHGVENVEAILGAAAPLAGAALESRAEMQLLAAARGPGGLVAAARLGDTDVVVRRLQGASVDAPGPRAAAEQARLMRLTPQRLSLRLALSAHLAEGAADELDAIAAEARAAGQLHLAAEALDAVLALQGQSQLRTSARADIALALDEPDAAGRCFQAATLATEVDEQLRFRRKAVELLVRRGAGASEVEAALRTLVGTRDNDVALVREALRLAEAVQLHGLVDELLTGEAQLAEEGRDQASAVRRRADHLRGQLKRPAAAFDVLLEAAGRMPDDGFGEEAYRLAVEEGLVEHLLAVVDDGLAEAALLGLLGRVPEALARARTLGGPAARLLEADLCRWLGDDAAAAAALTLLVEEGHADVATLIRLARTSLAAGDAERALTTSLALALDRSSDEALEVLAESLTAAEAGSDAVEQALAALPALLEGRGAGDPRATRLLDAWSRAAEAAGRSGDSRRALRRRAEMIGSDAAWVAWLREALRAEPDVLREVLPGHLERPAVIRALAVTDASALAFVLRDLLAERGPAVIDCLGALHDMDPLTEPLEGVLVDGLVLLGRHGEAAELVLVRPAASLGQLRDRQIEGARLALAAGATGRALDALLAIPSAAVDEDVRSVASALVTENARAGVLSLVRIAEATGAEADVDAALQAAAEAPSEIATAVAGWRLRAAPRDVRAWELASTRGAPAARRFFGAQLAASGYSRWPEALDDDARRVQRQAERDVEVHAPRAPDGDVIFAARWGAPEQRLEAWRVLAERERDAGRPIASARLLLRAGVPLTDAPIEVRLAADASLAEPRRRADAVADAVLFAQGPLNGRADGLRDTLLALDADGWLGARHRKALRRLEADDTWTSLIDAADDDGVTCESIVAKLGRHPTAAERSTAAALLASLGARGVARALQPALFSASAESRSGVSVEDLETRASMAGEAGLGLEQMSLLRTLAVLRGPRSDDERALRKAAAAEDRWALVAESLWREAAVTDDDDARGQLRVQRARVVAERLRRPDLALSELRAAAGLLGDDHAVAELRAQLAREAGDAQEEAEALVALEKQAGTPAERAAIVLRRAALHRGPLQAPGAALAALDGALSATGERGELLEARAQCLLDLGERNQAAATLLRAAAATQGEQRDALRAQAAALYEALGDVERAMGALERGAVEGDRNALEKLEALAREHDLPDVLERALSLAYEASEDEEPRRRIALERSSLLAERLERRPEAIALLETQAVADEGDLGARLALAAWYLEDRRLLDAALSYESASGIAGLPPAAVASAAREAASLLSARGDLERAGPLAERALEHGGADQATVAVAMAWHRAHERWSRVDELLDQRLDVAADGRERAFVWMERMHVRRDRLKDPEGAKQALHRALEVAPEHGPALDAMRALAAETDAWGPLRAALSRAVDLVDDSERRVLWLCEIAALDIERFDDLRAADATLDRALELAPEDPDVLLKRVQVLAELGQRDALTPLLERAVASGARLPADLQLLHGDVLLHAGDREGARRCFEAAADDEEQKGSAWERLLALAKEDGDDLLLARALQEVREAAADDAARQAALAREELSVRLRLGDRDGAVDAADALLLVEPDDSNAFEIVKADHLRRRRVETLVPKFEAWAEAPADDAEAARRLAELGAFLLDEVGSEGAARKAFESALARDPSEGVARVRLAAIAYGAQDWETALDLMDALNPGLWPRGEVALLFERAECAVKLGRDDIDQRLREVLRQDAKHVGALELMARLARERGDDDSQELALEALSLGIDEKRDPERAAKVLGELADLRAKQGRYEDAAAAAERALDLDLGSLVALERVAALYEGAGRASEAAEVWRRVAGLRPPGQQAEAHERRASILEQAGRPEDAADVWLSLYEGAGVERHKDEALRLAYEHKISAVFDRLGIAPVTMSVNDDTSAREHLEAALFEGDFDGAVTLAALALQSGAADDEVERMALEAAASASDATTALALCEERLQAGLPADGVRTWALYAGRIARDKLCDLQRAAGLMYRAHQAAPEDLDVRLELTALYGQIEELVEAAQTGVEQLLRRAPADPRVFHLASDVAAAQHNLERARAMRVAEHLLEGRASGRTAPPGSPVGSHRGPVTLDRVIATIGPAGVSRPLLDLLQVCAQEIEQQLAPRSGSLAGARILDDASPSAAALLPRVDTLLDGRALKIFVGPAAETHLFAGAPLHVVFPEQALLYGESVVAAHLGRAVASARLGGALFELLPKEQEERLSGLLRALADGNVAYPLARHVTAALDPAMVTRVGDLATAAMAAGPPDVASWRSAAIRLADRFSLVASGSLAAALDAGPLPGLYTSDPEELAQRLKASVRALDLCRFAARPGAWVLRRELGLSA